MVRHPRDAEALARFDRVLDLYPAAYRGDPLNLLFIRDAEQIEDPQAYLHELGSPFLGRERREYVSGQGVAWPFPCTEVWERPDPKELSQVLATRMLEAARLVPRQDAIAEDLAKLAARHKPDVVALIIVDGLSYYDLADPPEAEPRLVTGVTTTEHGFRAVVGSPSISRRLFTLGYACQRAFTYFDPSANALARRLHESFSDSQVRRVRAFEEIPASLADLRGGKAFLQITTAGLDQICHVHYDRPPRETYVEATRRNFRILIEALEAQYERALVALTADHGILWRDVVQNDLVVVADLFREDVRSPRYLKGAILRPYAVPCRCCGHDYSLLGYPYATRPFRSNEWGMHGGISAWESVVPLMVHVTGRRWFGRVSG